MKILNALLARAVQHSTLNIIFAENVLQMKKRLIGNRYSYVFDFVPQASDDVQPNDLGYLFHGVCEQTNQAVLIRFIANRKLIKNEQHLQIVQTIFSGLNMLHSGIVQTHDCLVDNDGIYVVREKLNGIDLQQVIFSGDYPHLRGAKFALKVAQKVCEILEVLHANKVTHLRIQPSNIFLVANDLGQIDPENPTVKLLNFEYAHINKQTILGFDQIPYALYYSSPEQILQAQVLMTGSCDLYSLGIVIYEAIARTHAFECDNNDQNLLLNMQISFPLKKHYRIDKNVFAFIQKATAKHIFKTPPLRYKNEARIKFFFNAQHQRFQSAAEMQQAIEFLIENLPAESHNSLLKKIATLFARNRKE